MAKRIIRAVILITSILLFLIGGYLIYQITAPEIEYRLDTPNEELIIETIQAEESLKENRLYIPSIGVDMEIGTDKSFLDYGGWIQESDLNDNPEMMAIHRFGFNGLSPEQKIKQTLYHVNKLKKGDVVYLAWNGELYEYTVSTVTEGVNNPEVKSDLIVYTCKFVSSKTRVFVVLQRKN